MFWTLNLRLFRIHFIGEDSRWEVYPTKFIDELCELGVGAGAVENL
jgi:hypothetical protein